jgi:hypothetical protein
LERVGDLGQVAGVENFTYSDGVRDGVRAARVRSGGGLDFTILLSRGMDIAHASYNGLPFAWISATGMAHPNRFEPEGRGWLRTFHGGLLTGCGLSNAGAATVDGDEPLGLHGHLSHIPAEDCSTSTVWQGDEAEFAIEGTMREARVFSENLRLRRRITTPLGGKSFTITDTVENAGYQTSPLMLLYHLNFGWPLVSEGTALYYVAASPTTARDAVAEKGAHRWMRLDDPTPSYAEQCFFHDPQTGSDGRAIVVMANPALHFGVEINYDKNAFPYLTQWKMMGQGEYVCGIEPANCRVLGRAAEREAGRLQQIEPGEVRQFSATLTVLDSREAIAGAEAEAVVNTHHSAP